MRQRLRVKYDEIYGNRILSSSISMIVLCLIATRQNDKEDNACDINLKISQKTMRKKVPDIPS